MEKTVKCVFITDYYGSAPALGNQGVLEMYIKKQIDKSFISFLDGIKKKGETIQDKAIEILSIFHRDTNGDPIIGNWMLKKCLTKTGLTIFNAMKNRSHPKKDIISNAIIGVEPIPNISVYNGAIITKPDGVQTYTVTVGRKSFFKAYEYIRAGTTFEYTVMFDDALLLDEHMSLILDKAGRFGVGAFRERFGKFKNI